MLILNKCAVGPAVFTGLMAEMSIETCPIQCFTLDNCGVSSEQIQSEFIPMLLLNKSITSILFRQIAMPIKSVLEPFLEAVKGHPRLEKLNFQSTSTRQQKWVGNKWSQTDSS